MARDHRKLRVFNEAHQIALLIYKETRDFPRDEWFGIRAQMRRAAVSIPTNIVEGNARKGTRDYLNFLNVSRGSASELEYLLGLSCELGYVPTLAHARLKALCDRLIPQLETLIQTMEVLLQQEEEQGKASRVRRGKD